MRIVLLGAPGSGKGTQAERLQVRYGIPQIATGDILRAEMAAGTLLGMKAKGFVNVGQLVPDDVIVGIMEGRLAEKDAASGFILDGFPRSIPQAEGLSKILETVGGRLDAVLKLDVSKRVLLDRMTSRRVCGSCGAVYNLATILPATPGRCDRCGGELVQREDDTEETVRRRLNVYEAATAPLIDYYDARGLLVIIHGEDPAEEVAQEIERALGVRSDG
jgi:adenylate kinase